MEQDDNGNLIIARILASSLIDKQGVLKVGDVILDVNGEAVNSPEELQIEVVKSDGNIQFTIAPQGDDIGLPIKPVVSFQRSLISIKRVVSYLRRASGLGRFRLGMGRFTKS